MGKWSGKTVIGLTGNIGTGKSVVRKMLEHQGAYGIDADQLSHRAMAKGAPGYKPVVEMFGRWVVAADGQIDRARLGKIVFSDPAALAELEKIIHPLVNQAVDMLVQRTSQPVIVIEAIKLLESDLRAACDSVWVTAAPPDVQLKRLMQARGMSEAEARQRITAQPPQAQKTALAQVVIQNAGTFTETWKQVSAAYQKISPEAVEAAPAAGRQTAGELRVVRGKPRHSAEIAELFNRLRMPSRRLNSDDIMAAFGEKAFLLLQGDGGLVGVIGWQVENLVARATDVVVDPKLPPQRALKVMLEDMERASGDLLAEAALVFVGSDLANLESVWKELGYTRKTPEELTVLAWKEAALESMPKGAALFFKQLRVDRIMRPV